VQGIDADALGEGLQQGSEDDDGRYGVEEAAHDQEDYDVRMSMMVGEVVSAPRMFTRNWGIL
jgi:hypothetical protein